MMIRLQLFAPRARSVGSQVLSKCAKYGGQALLILEVQSDQLSFNLEV